MADKYDKILEKYFTGGLDIEIKTREQELRHPSVEVDENVGGGRAQNKRSYSVENTMVKIESDEHLNELRELNKCLKTCVGSFDEEHREVFYQRYRNRMSWEQIAQINFTDERTLRRWRDDLKETCKWYGI
ncbi:DUF722 domain-containing protein [Weissella viridescens]|uniref:DUF722 domain-containing protein n=1 Tax=Weissella viridescens TaxID=1629 RepID=UPI003AF21D85